MTQAQFDAWLPGAIAGYAQEHVADGSWSAEEAEDKSRKEHEALLPMGLATPDQHLWNIVRAGDREPVGLLWVQMRPAPKPHVFVYNIEIAPEHRRHGYGEAAMRQLEAEAGRMGAETIRLHVFGHNTAARPLYEKLGYVSTNLLMAKDLRTDLTPRSS